MEIVFSAVGAFLLKMLGAALVLIGFLFLFVIVMIGLLLFCPIRYKGQAVYDGNLIAKGKVTWLFSLLAVSFSYEEEEASGKIRIFGIDLLKFLEKWQKHTTDSEKQSSKAKKKSKKSKNKDKPSKKQPDLQISQIEEAEQIEQIDLEINEEQEKAKQTEESKIYMFFWRVRELPQLVRKRIEGFFHALRNFFRNVKSKAEWLSQIKEFWKSENTQGMVCIFKDNVIHLLRKIKPKVLRGTVFFGTGDPCTTGQILGVAAILYAAYGRDIQVVPDFEEARLEGELFAKGRFSMITILLIVIKIFRSNEWKQFKYDFDQLKEAL